MATEVLPIPEENLAEFILILREGLKNTDHSLLTDRFVAALDSWCGEVEEYIKDEQNEN